MVPEASLKQTEAGLAPESAGWFVLNARDGRWFHQPGRGDSIPLTGCDEYEAETFFPMLGMSIQVLPPGEPNSTYRWETEQEDFLVLSGEALLIIEGQEPPLKRWDFVHCPPETRHVLSTTRRLPRRRRTAPSPTGDSHRSARPGIPADCCRETRFGVRSLSFHSPDCGADRTTASANTKAEAASTIPATATLRVRVVGDSSTESRLASEKTTPSGPKNNPTGW